MSRRHPGALRAATALALLAFAAAAGAQTAAAQSAAEPPLDSLRAAYLACDRTAMRVVLGAAAMKRCADIADALLARDFDGDLDRMLAWRRAEMERDTAVAARPVR